MKKTLFSLAAIFCLLTIIVSAASCVVMPPKPQQSSSSSSCNHDQKQAPVQQPTSSCCTIHHQPVSVADFAELKQPAVSSSFIELQIPQADLAAAVPSSAQIAGSPPLPPRIALRI